MPQDVEWRILAEEASQENNPKKLVEIVEALTRALDQQQHKEKAVSTSHTGKRIDHDALSIPRIGSPKRPRGLGVTLKKCTAARLRKKAGG